MRRAGTNRSNDAAAAALGMISFDGHDPSSVRPQARATPMASFPFRTEQSAASTPLGHQYLCPQAQPHRVTSDAGGRLQRSSIVGQINFGIRGGARPALRGSEPEETRAALLKQEHDQKVMFLRSRRLERCSLCLRRCGRSMSKRRLSRTSLPPPSCPIYTRLRCIDGYWRSSWSLPSPLGPFWVPATTDWPFVSAMEISTVPMKSSNTVSTPAPTRRSGLPRSRPTIMTMGAAAPISTWQSERSWPPCVTMTRSCRLRQPWRFSSGSPTNSRSGPSAIVRRGSSHSTRGVHAD
jgi:hypothetical protein